MNRISLKGKDIISINDLSKDEIIRVLETARRIEKGRLPVLRGKIMAALFFEPSTRTRLSFESAFNRLGGKVLGFSDAKVSSATKGETVYDTIKMVENYADIIVMRHNLDGAARVAAEATDKPVINAGDGSNQHPTQTLLDLYTIKQTQGKISGIKIAMVGDLKYGRTVHSLAIALSRFGCGMYFVSPSFLRMPDDVKEELDRKGIEYAEFKEIEEVVDRVDIVYMTRIQKERFSDITEYEKAKDLYILKKSMLVNARPNMKVLHPLPRVNEIHPDVDDTKHAYYFQQAKNGIIVRQAIVALLLGALR